MARLGFHYTGYVASCCLTQKYQSESDQCPDSLSPLWVGTMSRKKSICCSLSLLINSEYPPCSLGTEGQAAECCSSHGQFAWSYRPELPLGSLPSTPWFITTSLCLSLFSFIFAPYKCLVKVNRALPSVSFASIMFVTKRRKLKPKLQVVCQDVPE